MKRMIKATLALALALALAPAAPGEAAANDGVRAQAAKILARFAHEPDVVTVQQVAARYARLSSICRKWIFNPWEAVAMRGLTDFFLSRIHNRSSKVRLRIVRQLRDVRRRAVCRIGNSVHR